MSPIVIKGASGSRQRWKALPLNALICQTRRGIAGFLAVGALLSAVSSPTVAFTSNIEATEDLEYGAVLFDYFQRDYFSALVEQRYARTIGNPQALAPSGQLLEGGMMLSYGLADESQRVFDELLGGNASEEVRNRAWFYLAKLHYNKADFENARAAIQQIEGGVPTDVLVDYHYLATLVTGPKTEFIKGTAEIEKAASESPYFPYFLFNLAIAQLAGGELVAAVDNLERITKYPTDDESMAVLVDRARHGLAELALQSERLPAAWNYLSGIRTTGLYSNRALLSYAWAAINGEQFQEAIPALETLSQRSVALPEVQEAKVLLAHVYEQEGLMRRALKRNIQAEKEFAEGTDLISQARRVIDGQDVPREFISNLEAVMDDTDWYALRPSVDYERLTPFLVDLMASNAFNEALNELADLYVIEDNLNYWSDQAEQHQAILASAEAKTLTPETSAALATSRKLKNQFQERREEIELYSLVLDEEERERLTALLETTGEELELLENKVKRLEGLEQPYTQPPHFQSMVADNHSRIQEKLKRTEQQIVALEQVMRRLIKGELDKHEERMNYYAAQSRLAKARLYDMTLLSLERGPLMDGPVTDDAVNNASTLSTEGAR